MGRGQVVGQSRGFSRKVLFFMGEPIPLPLHLLQRPGQLPVFTRGHGKLGCEAVAIRRCGSHVGCESRLPLGGGRNLGV